MYLRVTNLHLENCHYPYHMGVGGTSPLPQKLLGMKRRGRRRGKKGEKKKGVGGRKRKMSPPIRHKSWIQVWILVMPQNFVVPEGLVVNKPQPSTPATLVSVHLSSNKLFVVSLIVVLLRLEAVTGYTKNYIYLEVNLNYLLLSYPIGPHNIIDLAK